MKPPAHIFGALAFGCAAAMAGPSPQTVACPATSTSMKLRFAVGVLPQDVLKTGMLENDWCEAQFPAGLTRPGTVTGSCGGVSATYEAVPATGVRIVWLAGDDEEPSPGTFVLKPGRAMSLAPEPLDRCKQPLSIGRSRYVTRWIATDACRSVVRVAQQRPFSPQDASSASEIAELTAVGAGSCRVGVEVLGLRGEITVTVK